MLKTMFKLVGIALKYVGEKLLSFHGQDIVLRQTPSDQDLLQPMPMWAPLHFADFQLQHPQSVTEGYSRKDSCDLEWDRFVAYVGRSRKEGRSAMVTESIWKAWLAKSWMDKQDYLEQTRHGDGRPSVDSPQLESTFKPRAHNYNPKEHKTFYLVGANILQRLVTSTASCTVRDLTKYFETTGQGFAESTIRGTCKELVKDGILTQLADTTPATFQVADEAAALDFVQKHLERTSEPS